MAPSPAAQAIGPRASQRASEQSSTETDIEDAPDLQAAGYFFKNSSDVTLFWIIARTASSYVAPLMGPFGQIERMKISVSCSVLPIMTSRDWSYSPATSLRYGCFLMITWSMTGENGIAASRSLGEWIVGIFGTIWSIIVSIGRSRRQAIRSALS